MAGYIETARRRIHHYGDCGVDWLFVMYLEYNPSNVIADLRFSRFRALIKRCSTKEPMATSDSSFTACHKLHSPHILMVGGSFRMTVHRLKFRAGISSWFNPRVRVARQQEQEQELGGSANGTLLELPRPLHRSQKEKRFRHSEESIRRMV